MDQVLTDVGDPPSFRGDSSTRAGFGSLVVDALSIILPVYENEISVGVDWGENREPAASIRFDVSMVRCSRVRVASSCLLTNTL